MLGGVAATRGQASGTDADIDAYVATMPLGRMASEEDIVGAAGSLLGEALAHITGQNITVDGGFSAW